MKDFADTGNPYIVLTESIITSTLADFQYLMDFKQDMKDFGLTFVDAHAPWGTWADPGMPLEDWHEALILKQRMAIGFCKRCGVTTMAYHTGNTFNSIFGQNLVLDDYYRMLLRSLEELLPYAERDNVIIALENQWTPLNHTSVLLKVINHFNSPYLGFCCDVGHANVMEKGQACPEKSCVPYIWKDLGVPVIWEEQVIEKMAPWLVNCHLHDNNGLEDWHWLPGQGNIDWQRIFKVLKSAPKLQCIQNEATLPKTMSTASALKQVKEFFLEVTNSR